MHPAIPYSRILVILGSIAMLVGALDLMEGSLVILPGSALVALGTCFGNQNHRCIVYRIWVFILIAIGVGAIWGFTMLGGIGGKTGYSEWWGLLMLPYLIGWTMGIWGPGSPRWVLALGILVSLFHLWLVTVIMGRRNQFDAIALALGLLGLVTIAGCIFRWKTINASKLLAAS
jgi:hypothetical protein